MNAEEIIRRKRDGFELSREEIEAFIQGIVAKTVMDYQISAWTMAVFFRGMNARETADLALAMAHSGDMADLSGISGVKVDKHSTGGVGDKTTPVVVALAAAAGIPVAKMSGRGLGFTGGTVDKFEAIPGFRSVLTREEFINQVNRTGLAVVAQSGDLAPADKKIYAIRDVTATVDSIPLIASSVMSKKLASGADAFVLDVKTGTGAFMRETDAAIELARAMVEIGRNAGKQVTAVLSTMDQPLGYAIGNALEIEESVRTLQGEGPEDLTQLCLTLAAHMAVLGQKAASVEEGFHLMRKMMDSGLGLAKLRDMVAAQGGDPSVLAAVASCHPVTHRYEVRAKTGGWLNRMQTDEIGRTAMMLGAGRERAEDRIDYGAGIIMRRKLGDRVESGDILAEFRTNRPDRLAAAEQRLLDALEISQQTPISCRLILGTVTREGFQPL